MAETVPYSSALGLTSGSFARKSRHSLFHQERIFLWNGVTVTVRQHFSDGLHLPLPPGNGMSVPVTMHLVHAVKK